MKLKLDENVSRHLARAASSRALKLFPVVPPRIVSTDGPCANRWNRLLLALVLLHEDGTVRLLAG
jgi:hypothetical protein